MAQDGKKEEADELKKKLLGRVAIAGVLIVVLLGGLALFDYLVTPAPAPPAAPAVPPPASAPEPEEAPAEAAKEEPAPAEKEAPAAEPEKTEMPLAPPPAAKPAPAPPRPAPAPKPVSVPPAKPVEAPPPLPAIPRGYVLQMGVFTNTANAEDLRARLDQAGIPAYIEARVHVGPFKTQKEAALARGRLKELGLGPGLLLPPKR